MQKTAVGGGLLPLMTAPVQEVPASLVLSFAAFTLLLSTFLTVLCLHQPGASSLQTKPLPAELSNG